MGSIEKRAAIVVLTFCIAAPVSPTDIDRAHEPVPPEYPVGVPSILLGTAWYPEQWPEPRWDADLQLMEDAGIHLVRVGEFAWARMEPHEGEYDFDWLRRAIEKAARHHIVTVLGSPTDALPAWMTSKYADILRIDENGRRVEHGNRRQFSYTSPRFRQFCREIAEQLAIRFGRNPNVIGWQVGNEFSLGSFDDVTKNDFHDWLEAKYKTLDALNEHWTTQYWSQVYDRWDEIPLEDSSGNPGLLLDHKRFVSDVWKSFEENQITAIRRHSDSRQFITTNIGGLAWTDKWDHYTVTEPLDLAAWDEYVGEGHIDPYREGAMHDLIRGLKQKNFWVMETQPGFVNWAPVSTSLEKGEVRRIAWAAVGHGADTVAYWQWRSALNGQEQYHGVIIGPDGTPVPIYSEIRQIGEDFAKVAPTLKGTTPVSQVAILLSYPSRWAIDFQPQNRNYDQLKVLLDYYRPLRNLAQSIDIVNSYTALNKYKLVVAPDLNVLPDDLGRHLLEYVEAGGHLVLGPRSGMKNQFDALDTRRQPGPLVEPLGGRVEQFYALEQEIPASGDWGNSKVSLWAEMLSTRAADTQVIMRYGKSNGWLDGQPSVLTRKIGIGRITYIGAVFDPATMDVAAKWMVGMSGVTAAFGPLPDGVEACPRVGAGRTVVVLINHTAHLIHVPLRHAMRSMLISNAEVRAVDLPVQGVDVLEDRSRRER